MPDRWRNAEITLTIVHGDSAEPYDWDAYDDLTDAVIEIAERLFLGRVTMSGRFVELEDGDPVAELALVAAAKEIVRLLYLEDAQWTEDDGGLRELDQAAFKLRDAIGNYVGRS